MQTECGMRENNKTFTETNKIIVHTTELREPSLLRNRKFVYFLRCGVLLKTKKILFAGAVVPFNFVPFYNRNRCRFCLCYLRYNTR